MKTKTLLLLALATSQATAAPALTASEVLRQFNLVTLSDAVSNSHVDGRSFIGGSLAGGEFFGHPSDVQTSEYAGLTVKGSASNIKVNGGGGVVVEGSLKFGTVNGGVSAVLSGSNGSTFNGPSFVLGQKTNNNFNGQQLNQAPDTVNAAKSTAFNTVLGDLSSSLSKLDSTGSSVTLSGNRATFSATANAQGLAVFNLKSIDKQVFSKGEFSFNWNGANTVIFNVDESTLNFASNFLDNSAAIAGTKAIWNFYGATDLKINNQFGGVILAPLAKLTNYQNIEGTVLVNELDQRGEIHIANFGGSVSLVPEPASYSLLLAGLGFIALFSRRLRTQAIAMRNSNSQTK